MNELATNTVKHTLHERDTARISVRVEQQDHMVHCEFRDDGPGYPQDVLQLERYNVGFELIQTIVKEGLRGDLKLLNDHGAVSRIRFKAQVEPNGSLEQPGRK